MRLPFAKTLIIGVLSLLLGGCSAVRFTYGNGSQLAWWWLDGYIDFSSAQSPRVKEAIDRWFAWHRSTQLLDYAAFLAAAQSPVLEQATPASACRLWEQAREKLDPALDRAIEAFADQVPGLGEAQFKHLERRFAKTLDDMKRDYLQPDLAERRSAAIDRVLERTDQLYGSVNSAQRQLIAAGVDASPFDPAAWKTEREKRQRDTVATLRRLVAEKAPRDQVVAALHMLAERAERSPDPAYRAYQIKLYDYNCGFAARVHNAATPAQRIAARDRLKGWEEDLRALAAETPGAAVMNPQ